MIHDSDGRAFDSMYPGHEANCKVRCFQAIPSAASLASRRAKLFATLLVAGEDCRCRGE